MNTHYRARRCPHAPGFPRLCSVVLALIPAIAYVLRGWMH